MSGPPNSWSYVVDPRGPAARGNPRRRFLIVGAAVLALALVALTVIWFTRPTPAPAAQTDAQSVDKTLLNDKPPTVIQNALDVRSLYPPGYIDFDSSKSTSENEYPYDPAERFEVTSSPPGCVDDPLYNLEHDYDNTDPNHYDDYPIQQLMYPVDDPGGNSKDDRGFLVSIFPAKDPTTLQEFLDWFAKCDNAQVTTTTTKGGQVVRTVTDTIDPIILDAPRSAAIDSFALSTRSREQCNINGLVRGLIVNVICPVDQKEAGAQLYRTVVQRIQDI